MLLIISRGFSMFLDLIATIIIVIVLGVLGILLLIGAIVWLLELDVGIVLIPLLVIFVLLLWAIERVYS